MQRMIAQPCCLVKRSRARFTLQLPYMKRVEEEGRLLAQHVDSGLLLMQDTLTSFPSPWVLM